MNDLRELTEYELPIIAYDSIVDRYSCFVGFIQHGPRFLAVLVAYDHERFPDPGHLPVSDRSGSLPVFPPAGFEDLDGDGMITSPRLGERIYPAGIAC
jgi:hypothetical protein